MASVRPVEQPFKTNRRRFSKISENAAEWLEAYRQHGGAFEGKVMPLADRQLREHRKANWTAAGIRRAARESEEPEDRKHFHRTTSLFSFEYYSKRPLTRSIALFGRSIAQLLHCLLLVRARAGAETELRSNFVTMMAASSDRMSQAVPSGELDGSSAASVTGDASALVAARSMKSTLLMNTFERSKKEKSTHATDSRNSDSHHPTNSRALKGGRASSSCAEI